MEVVALYVIAGTLGAMLFFAIGVAPTVFQALPAEQAGLFLRQLFPRSCLSLIIGSPAGGVLWLGAQPLASGVCLLIAVSTLWIRQWLVPRINALRDRELSGDVSAGEGFARLHRLSVAINMLQLLALLGILITA